MLAELGSGAPTLLIVDDGIELTVRRSTCFGFSAPAGLLDLPAMLLLTYRDDEAEDGHPLRSLLGGMTSAEPSSCGSPR